MNIDTVPTEIFTNVAENTSNDTLRALRLTCRRFATATKFTVYRELVVAFGSGSESDARNLERLELIAGDSEGTIARHVRTLTIISTDAGHHGRTTYLQRGGDGLTRLDRWIKEILKPAIAALKFVSRVNWNPKMKGGWDHHKEIFSIIQGYEHLQAFSLYLPDPPLAVIEAPRSESGYANHIHNSLDIDKLKNLRSLSISIQGQTLTPPIETNLFLRTATIVSNSPGLTCLEIADLTNAQNQTQFTFDQVVYNHLPSFRFERLGIENVRVTAKLLTPHIRHLHSFKFIKGFKYLDRTDLTRLSMPNNPASPAEEFWESWPYDVRLEELEVDHIPPSLIRYLSSYSSLRKISLDVEGFPAEDAQRERDEAATAFWNEVIPRHKDSLTHVRIFPTPDQWAFTPASSARLMECSRLVSLDMCVLYDDLYPPSDPQPRSTSKVKAPPAPPSVQRSPFADMLDAVFTHPTLQTLRLCPKDPVVDKYQAELFANSIHISRWVVQSYECPVGIESISLSHIYAGHMELHFDVVPFVGEQETVHRIKFIDTPMGNLYETQFVPGRTTVDGSRRRIIVEEDSDFDSDSEWEDEE